MRRTSVAALIVAFIVGGAAGFVVDQALTAAARPTFSPSGALPLFLVLLGGAVIVLALPVRRSVQGAPGAPVNPFRALRVVMLAKASSVVGAVVAGFAAGLVVFVLTRPVAPAFGAVWPAASTLLAALVLVAAGLVAEHMCTIGGDDSGDEPPPPPQPTLGLSHGD